MQVSLFCNATIILFLSIAPPTLKVMKKCETLNAFVIEMNVIIFSKKNKKISVLNIPPLYLVKIVK